MSVVVWLCALNLARQGPRLQGQGEGNSQLARRQERCATEAEGAASDPPCPGRLAKPRAAEWCRAGAFFKEVLEYICRRQGVLNLPRV